VCSAVTNIAPFLKNRASRAASNCYTIFGCKLLDGVAVAAWLFFVFLIVAAFVTVGWIDSGEVFGLSDYNTGRLMVLIALLAVTTATVASFYRNRVGTAARHFLIWVGLFIGALGIYAYRTELLTVAERVRGELTPGGTQVDMADQKAVRLKRAAWSNHFMAQAKISGVGVEMIVDTGASTVVLRHEDAKRLGIDMKVLRYTVPVQTANGSSFAARVQLAHVSIGGMSFDNVEALIAKPGSLHQSLLGMSFLSRLRSIEMSKDYLVLRG
jgi:aspartyl protease family protein